MKKEFNIKLEGKEWSKYLDEAYKKRAKDVKVDGFRKGSVPKDIYIKNFGIESLFMDAVDASVDFAYKRMMEENPEVEPAVMPSYDIAHICEDDCEFVFSIVLKPEVKLGKYKDLGIKKKEAKATKDEIDHEINSLKEQYVELKVKSGKVEKDDEVKIDFEGFMDGKPFEGGKANNYRLVIGSNSFIPGFEDGIIGMEVGEEKDLNLKFPSDYHAEDLKGKEVLFKVKVNEVKTRIYPNMDAEFFKDLDIPEVDSEEKLRNFIESNIKLHKERENENEHIEKCLETVVKNAKFEVPEEMVNEEVERMINEFSEQLRLQGIELNQYLQMLNTNETDLRKNFKEEASKRVNYRLVIEAVAKKEKFEVTDEELDKHIEELSKRYGAEESEFLTNVGGKKFVKYDLEFKKALELIIK